MFLYFFYFIEINVLISYSLSLECSFFLLLNFFILSRKTKTYNNILLLHNFYVKICMRCWLNINSEWKFVPKQLILQERAPFSLYYHVFVLFL